MSDNLILKNIKEFDLNGFFLEELNNVCLELKNLSADNVILSDSQIILDSVEKEVLFLELKEAINTKRPKKCTPIIQEIEKYKLNDNDKKLFELVKDSIENFDFEKASRDFQIGRRRVIK